MSDHESHTTYPIPKYWPKWFHRLRKPCPECERLTKMRDNTYDSIAQTHFGHPNQIFCTLCGEEYLWSWIGMGHFGNYWGWKKPQQKKPCPTCGDGKFLYPGEKCPACPQSYEEFKKEYKDCSNCGNGKYLQDGENCPYCTRVFKFIIKG